MDVGGRTVQGWALGDAPSSERPHHLILQQPADLQSQGNPESGKGHSFDDWEITSLPD